MRAAVTVAGDAALEIQELPDPTPEPGDLVLEVDACGICGSDLHLSQTYRDYAGVVFGHEFCGKVVAVGTEAEGYAEGDWVVGFPLAGCRKCAACLAGNPAKCPSMLLSGVQRPGGYAQYVPVGAAESFKLPREIDPSLGALVEPLAVAHHALDRTPREPGEPILVLGGGPVGAAVALWARVLGASEVVVSDPQAGRRQLAERLGAAVVDPSQDDVAEAFTRITGSAPKVVVECVGLPGLLQHATEVVAMDGHVTLAGACVAPETFTPVVATSKELILQFVLYYRRRDFAQTLHHLTSGRLDPAPLVTDHIALDAVPDRFEALMRPGTDCKVLIRPNA